MEAARTSETSVDIQLRTRQYIPEDSELHTRRRENLKSHIFATVWYSGFERKSVQMTKTVERKLRWDFEADITIIIIITTIISSPVVLQSLQGPWPPHTGGFVILLSYLVGIFRTSDQPVAKASTYARPHNTETQRQASMPRAVFEPAIPVIKRPRPMNVGVYIYIVLFITTNKSQQT
jgi:hypothetical protein